MRFNHSRKQDGGELHPQKGGFFSTPPQTPPCNKPFHFNDVAHRKGEMGGFSSTLYVGEHISSGRPEYIDHPAKALGTRAPSPPAPSISPAKLMQGNDKIRGGVFKGSPPAALPAIEAVQDLPVEVVAGLHELRDRRPPPITRPEVWQEIVDDAVTLAIDGSAGRALDQGWDVLDLFGVGARDSDAFEGLAVWLARRGVVEITVWTARTTCGATFYREAFGRPNSPRLPAVPLWQFGRR